MGREYFIMSLPERTRKISASIIQNGKVRLERCIMYFLEEKFNSRNTHFLGYNVSLLDMVNLFEK